MADETDDNDREAPPPTSRIRRGSDRRFRELGRATRSRRDRYHRLHGQRAMPELIRAVIARNGLTDEVRRQVVGLYWSEMADARVAPRTYPVSVAQGVLTIAAVSSTWVQEARFYRDQIIEAINRWADDNRAWLGPPPLVVDVRVVLGMRQRPLVDPDHVRRFRLHHEQRSRPRPSVMPPGVSTADREAICAETSVIDDPDLRAIVETVRLNWNR